MANEEHVAILKQGVEVWNKWREENPNVMVDLSRVEISGIDLSNADFIGANLKGANLRRSILFRTDFSWANLSIANLRKADSIEAILIGANLIEADISWANLSSANLEEANLTGASLRGVDFGKAEMGWTRLYEVDLSKVQGLEMVIHHAPSRVDLITLRQSKGKIPEVFLRGIGWSDYEIETILPIYKDRAFQFYSGFISYSSKDEEFARRLYNDLQAAGVRVWFAPEDLKGGDEFWKVINKEIRLRDKLILVLSENSVNSEWVAHEVEQALEEEKVKNEGLHPAEPIDPVLLPVTIDNAVFECKQPWATKIRRDRNIRLMQDWKNHDAYQKGLDLLIKDLKGTT